MESQSAPITWLEFCGFLDPGEFAESFMLYAAYLDGSGKLHDPRSTFVVLAGVVLRENAVGKFWSGWASILREHCEKSKHRQVRYLHVSNEAKQRRGEFQEWQANEVDALLLDLARFTRDSSYRLIWAPADKRRFQELDPAFRSKLRGLNELSFEVLLNGIAGDSAPDDSLHLACDDCQDEAREMYELLWRYKNRYPARKDYVVSICFVDDRFYPAIQAADLFAYAVREEEERRALMVPSEPSALYSEFTANGSLTVEYAWAPGGTGLGGARKISGSL